MRPTDMADMRCEQLRWYRSAHGQNVFLAVAAQWGFHGFVGTHALHEKVLAEERMRWETADLYHVNEDMTHLAIGASQSLPGFDLHPQDLPSRYGCMYFHAAYGLSGDTPGQEALPVRVVLWGPTEVYEREKRLKHSGVWLSLYTKKSDAPNISERVPSYVYDNEMFIPFNEQIEIPSENRQSKLAGFALTLISAWLLMNQRVASVETQHPNRATAKRVARAGQEVRPVRVITLRHPSQHHATGPGIPHSHRWIVRGHWRQQWYPSTKRHLPLWIDPHVKGPEDAPLLTGEKVYAWTR